MSYPWHDHGDRIRTEDSPYQQGAREMSWAGDGNEAYWYDSARPQTSRDSVRVGDSESTGRHSLDDSRTGPPAGSRSLTEPLWPPQQWAEPRWRTRLGHSPSGQSSAGDTNTWSAFPAAPLGRVPDSQISGEIRPVIARSRSARSTNETDRGWDAGSGSMPTTAGARPYTAHPHHTDPGRTGQGTMPPGTRWGTPAPRSAPPAGPRHASAPPYAQRSSPPASGPPSRQRSVPPAGPRHASAPPYAQHSTPPYAQRSTPPYAQRSAPPMSGRPTVPPRYGPGPGRTDMPGQPTSAPPLPRRTPGQSAQRSAPSMSPGSAPPLHQRSAPPMAQRSTPPMQRSAPPIAQRSMAPMQRSAPPMGQRSAPPMQRSAPPYPEHGTTTTGGQERLNRPYQPSTFFDEAAVPAAAAIVVARPRLRRREAPPERCGRGRTRLRHFRRLGARHRSRLYRSSAG